LMSTRAKYMGAQGVVVDGNFRDLNEHREMGFPVRNPPYYQLLLEAY
jgi:regulator of RNase E activity RraA